LISLVPNDAPLMEGNDCHNPGGPAGGQFCGKGAPDLVAGMRAKFLPTTDRYRTRFLLPDGTRMSFYLADGARWQGRPMATTHEQAATILGVRPADVFAAHIVRYLPKEGVDAGAKMTDAQAQTIAGDWAIYKTRLHIDVTKGLTGHIKILDPPDISASRIRSMVNSHFNESRGLR
jgi:hypothetical protein